MRDFLMGHYAYAASLGLVVVGLYAILVKRNLVKKLIGMNIFQWSIILFFVSIGAKVGGKIPIIDAHGAEGAHQAVEAAQYINPLPYVLMLTAIVVGVGTTGVALALLLRIHKIYGSVEENEIVGSQPK